MVLDSVACRLGELGDVLNDVLSVLGVDRVVPIVVRVLVSLPAGFPVTLCNTAIQSCDRHGN